MTENNLFAVGDGEGAGAVVHWRLEGAVDPDVLSAAWEAANLNPDHLPELPAPSTALSRAVKTLQKGRTLVRPLEDHKGYAVVREKAHGQDLDYTSDLRVGLDAVARLVFSDPDHLLAPTVRAAYALALNEFDTADVAPWLVRLLVKKCDAVSLRPNGGMYYVPPSRMEVWDAIVGALRAASGHKLFKIPALSSRDALDAVLDAVEVEAREEAEAMARELAEKVASPKGGVSDRVGKARLSRCDAVEQKVTRYEALLGTRLDGIRERLGDLRASLSAAMLTEAAADQAAEEAA